MSMIFDFAGETYAIEFKREPRRVQHRVGGHTVSEISEHPYTIARLKVVAAEQPREKWATYREAEAGCNPLDVFNKEQGRKAALRKLTKTLQSKEMRTIMWETYINRANPRSQETR